MHELAVKLKLFLTNTGKITEAYETHKVLIIFLLKDGQSC